MSTDIVWILSFLLLYVHRNRMDACFLSWCFMSTETVWHIRDEGEKRMG